MVIIRMKVRKFKIPSPGVLWLREIFDLIGNVSKQIQFLFQLRSGLFQLQDFLNFITLLLSSKNRSTTILCIFRVNKRVEGFLYQSNAMRMLYGFTYTFCW